MKVQNAIVIDGEKWNEARCRRCGKLLLTYKKTEKSKNGIDISSQRVIIVSRCTRSDCKTDNRIVI